MLALLVPGVGMGGGTAAAPPVAGAYPAHHKRRRGGFSDEAQHHGHGLGLGIIGWLRGVTVSG